MKKDPQEKQSTLPSQLGLAKPFFKQVPLSEFDVQILDMQNVWHVSNTLSLEQILKVKTIK